MPPSGRRGMTGPETGSRTRLPFGPYRGCDVDDVAVMDAPYLERLVREGVGSPRVRAEAARALARLDRERSEELWAGGVAALHRRTAVAESDTDDVNRSAAVTAEALERQAVTAEALESQAVTAEALARQALRLSRDLASKALGNRRRLALVVGATAVLIAMAAVERIVDAPVQVGRVRQDEASPSSAAVGVPEPVRRDERFQSDWSVGATALAVADGHDEADGAGATTRPGLDVDGAHGGATGGDRLGEGALSPTDGENSDAPCGSRIEGAVTAEAAAGLVGTFQPVEFRVVATKDTGRVTFLNSHDPYQGHFYVAIFPSDYDRFPDHPALYFRRRCIVVQGSIELYRGTPQIVLRGPEDVRLVGD